MYTSNGDSTILISIVSDFFMSKNRKSHGMTLPVFSSDKIIFNNKGHEIDDLGTNELS